METISVNGMRLSCVSLGARGGRPVVLLHGLVFGNIASWYTSFGLPLARTRHVLIYDQRGHGGSSDAATGFDLDTQANDLHQLLAQTGATGQIDLVGHSMGALIALRFALRFPGRVGRLVLVEAPMPAREYVAPGLRDCIGETMPDSQSGTAVIGRRQARQRARVNALLRQSTLVADVQAMAAEADTDLARLDLPVLLIYGSRSSCLRAGHHLHRRLPCADLKTLEGGHYLLEEAPAALCDQLLELLSC